MRSVLFVCTANICRSPVAEGVLRSMLAARGIEAGQARIDSAGTHDYRLGQPPCAPAVESAAKRGYVIAHPAARLIAPQDFDDFDHIVAMDRGNLAQLASICPTHLKSKIELLLDYGGTHHGEDVPDPFGGQAEGFESALDLIEEGCRGLVEALAGKR